MCSLSIDGAVKSVKPRTGKDGLVPWLASVFPAVVLAPASCIVNVALANAAGAFSKLKLIVHLLISVKVMDHLNTRPKLLILYLLLCRCGCE
jgi:hypothetical protein